MRKHALAAAAAALTLATPASAQPPVAATWAGIGYEICPLGEPTRWPCSYTGESIACEAATMLEGRRPTVVPCATTLTGAVGGPDPTTGTFTYRDELATDYRIAVVIRTNGVYTGTLVTEDGVVTVTGQLHPFTGVLERTR